MTVTRLPLAIPPYCLASTTVSLLSANWKGFDVSIMLQGVGQYSKTYSGAGIYESSGNFYKMHMKRWSEERYNNHEKITYPRLSSSGGPSLQPNDFFIMDASYIRLKMQK